MLRDLIVLASVVGAAVSQYTYTDETTLQGALTTGYEASVRPDGRTDISLNFGLMSISDLDIVSQEFAVTGFVIATWTDSRLTWTPASYGNITQSMIKFSNIWTPALLVSNGADGIKIINDDSDLASIYSYLLHTGEVNWLAPLNAVTQCGVNIQAYPFDSQTCTIIVSSWMFATDMLYFYSTFSEVNLDMFIENGEWDILSTSVANVTRTLLGFPTSCVEFTFNLQRKYSYYVINMLLPVTILAFLAPFQFLLPVESGEQNGYSLTILLSLSVVMTLVAESIPPTANHISVLSVYLLATYILCSCQTVSVVLMSRYHCFAGRGYQLGNRTNRIAHKLAKLTFYRRPGDDNDAREESNTKGPALDVDQDTKGSDTPIAWSKEKQKQVPDDSTSKRTETETTYSFEEFVLILNNLNFFVYFIITCIITLIFMVLLKTL